MAAMKRMRVAAVIVAGIAAPAALGAARPDCASQVDGLMAPWNRDDAPGAVVGVFEDGAILHAKGYGIANLDYGIPLSPRTVLRTGSVSKQFIGMAIALLAEQGRLEVGDDIRKYLPEMPDYGAPITIAHLLHHTSGIREYLTLVTLIGKPEGSGYVYTPQDLLAMLVRQKALDFKPGEQYAYSNSGYFLLTEIIGRVSHMSASGFLERHIFTPLGMKATRLHDDPDAIIRDRGVGYAPLEHGGYRLDILRLKVVGDLGVATTVEDLLLWDRNFHDNRLGSASARLIETDLTPGTLNDGQRLDYAYGLELGRYRGLETVSHSGSEPGHAAYTLRFPGERFTVVVLSNLSTFPSAQIATQVADRCLADRLTGAPHATPDEPAPDEAPPTRALTAAEVAAYAGNYTSEELDVTYRLRERGGELQLAINALSGSLVARAADRLWWSAGEAEFRFTRDPDGRVSGFSLDSESVRDLQFVRQGGD